MSAFAVSDADLPLSIMSKVFVFFQASGALHLLASNRASVPRDVAHGVVLKQARAQVDQRKRGVELVIH